jgi:hypothetical protein
MKRIASYVVALFGWALLATVSQAQYQNPAVSPYINLNRGGNPAINYYGLVRPQFAANSALQSFGADLHTLSLSPGTMGNANQRFSQTGNRSSFMTHTRYFMNNGGGKSGTNPNGGLGAGTPGFGAGTPGLGVGTLGLGAGTAPGMQQPFPTLPSFGR